MTKPLKTRADLTDRERLLAETCVHEAGHAIAGVLLGRRLRAATVTGGLKAGQIRGLTTLDPLPPGREPEVAFTGPWAQVRWRHDRTPTQREVYAVLALNRDGDDAVLLASGGTSAGAAIVPTLQRDWPAICTLAGAICSNIVARHTIVCAALGLSTDPATAAHQLA